MVSTLTRRRGLLVPWLVYNAVTILVMLLVFTLWTFLSFFISILLAIIFPVLAGLVLGVWILLWKKTYQVQRCGVLNSSYTFPFKNGLFCVYLI